MKPDLDDCVLAGSALTPSFLQHGLTANLPVIDGWDTLRTALRTGGAQRVHQHVTTPLAAALGYHRPRRQDPIATREGPEDGGWLLQAPNGARLRTWSIATETDLDAANLSPKSARSSPTRIAQRVLLATKEQAGLITNGDILRLLLSDPSKADSHLTIPISDWRDRNRLPDSYRLLQALAAATNLPNLPDILEAARLHQAKVTVELRRQAKDAVTGFINALPDLTGLDPADLWREGLILVYRLLFILKLESPAEPGVGFSFASARLWRTALSPNGALAPLVRRHLDHNADTGRMLETGLRNLFAIFRDGLTCSELCITALGGALFGPNTTPLLDQLAWGDRSVAILLDRLLWLASGERARVHYGSLDVEDLGSVYEGLLEQEPGIATEPLLRRRRGRHETVHPAATNPPDIAAGKFFLRSGMGRKSTGSFYTPHDFVRFLVRETLDPLIAALNPPDNPDPAALLTLKIVDPATGSGHFLVEACRHLGEHLLAACRQCDENGQHDRIAALPDAHNTIAAYLPTRGFRESKARAICRRLVATHCLYGCDRNKLAIELAKLSLWLESYAEGLPLTFLDHRLVHGDALTGPFFDRLSTLPVTGGPLDPLLAQGVSDRLTQARTQARDLVATLNASIGHDTADLAQKQAAKTRLDAVLHPLRQLAKTWSGAAMLRDRDADDLWLALAIHVADTGTWPDALTGRQAALLAAGADSIAWDLTFPEIFPGGFSVVLGNPPWDVVLPSTKDFVADYDPAILEAKTRAAREAIEQAVLSRPGAAAAFEAYRSGFDRIKRIAHRLYAHQTTAGGLDLFRLFAERNMQLTAADGAIGVLMPSAFHANDGTTAIRHLYLAHTKIDCCLSFENRRRIFDIDSRFKFDLIVARKPGPTQALRCGFYLDRIEDAADPKKIMTYPMDFLIHTGGASLTPLELRGHADFEIARQLFANPDRLQDWCTERHIRFGCDLHMTADSGTFRPVGRAALTLHEGKTFHQYIGEWDAKPRYSVAPASLPPGIAEAARHHRLAFRDIARSNDERTMIAFIAPPGTVFGHTATVEKTPWARPVSGAFLLCALFNSFPFDWLIRQKAATHLSLYLLNALPVPRFNTATARFLSQAGHQLSQAHNAHTRAETDAVIAHAYGLSRDQYAHILNSFSHRSHPGAPALCLQAYDDAISRNKPSTCPTCRSSP